MKKDNLFIIEDEIYFDTEMINDSIVYVSTAKDSQYYQSLINNADEYAAERLVMVNDIYVWLLDLNYLDDPKYNLSWEYISEQCAAFTFNMRKLLENYPDVENQLHIVFCDKAYGKILDMIFKNNKQYKCSVCGACTFSRELSTDNRDKLCLSCQLLSKKQLNAIEKVCNEFGVLQAVNQRLKESLIKSRFNVAKDKSIPILLDEFKKNNSVDFYKDQVDVIKQLLNKNGMDNYEVFCCNLLGIVIWNREALQHKETFVQSVATNADGTEILTIFNSNAIYIDDKAIEFALKELNPFKSVDIEILKNYH